MWIHIYFSSCVCGVVYARLQWLWCLSMLCEVAFAFDLASVDCIMTAEMIHTLAIQLERAAEHCPQTQCRS